MNMDDNKTQAQPEPEPVKEEVKAEEKVEESVSPDASQGGPKKPAKSVSKNLEEIIEKIEKLSVLELADLVHALEDKFGVFASAGANKIGAIKAVRELVQTLGLKEAKDLVEAAPKPVLESVNKATAEEAKAKLTAAGATVELQ